MTAALVGVPPACLHVPDGVLGSYADEVGETAQIMGRTLDPEQLVAVDALTSYGRGGRWPTLEAGVEQPRQNGKTGGILLPIAVAQAIHFEPDLTIWTAHRLDTSQGTFADLQGLIAASDEFSRRVKRITQGNGDEGVDFVNGSRLEIKARSGRVGRGKSGTNVFVDEALFWTDDQAGALLPILATRSMTGMPRVWYGSSAAKAESVYLRKLRARALAADPRLVWAGWWARGGWRDPGCETDACSHQVGVEGCSLDDVELWGSCNPQLYRRTSLEFLRDMRATMSPLEFGREFLGWQEDDEAESRITPAAWGACKDVTSRPLPHPVVLAVDTTKGLRSAVVAAVGWREDGRAHGELLRIASGTEWVAGMVSERQRAFGCRVMMLGGSATSQALLPDLETAGVRVDEVSMGDYPAACGSFAREVAEGRWRHLGDPNAAAAVAGASSRDVGDDGSWRWSAKDSTADISPLVAFTLARWGLAGVQVASDVF